MHKDEKKLLKKSIISFVKDINDDDIKILYSFVSLLVQYNEETREAELKYRIINDLLK